jgi:hypothetical protein
MLDDDDKEEDELSDDEDVLDEEADELDEAEEREEELDAEDDVLSWHPPSAVTVQVGEPPQTEPPPVMSGMFSFIRQQS